jgi:hypothetical protein
MRHPEQFGMMFYKGTRPGIPGIYNRFVRAWDSGPYSHVEVTFSDGWSASSSFEDKGVRFKLIDFDPAKWDFVSLPPEMEDEARTYFVERAGRVKYDLQGNFHFMIGFIPHANSREFCSESGAGCIKLEDSWRFTPNSLSVMARHISKNYFRQAA